MDKCLIRVDGNSVIGTGHQMRCMAIANELEDFCEVLFVSADEENGALLKERGYDVRVLGTCWNQMESEQELLHALIEDVDPCFVFVDSYQVTQEYLSALRKRVKTVYIDDLHEMIYPCDILINYSMYAEDIDYINEYEGTGTRFLLGCNYVPLRSEFKSDFTRTIREDIQNVLILSGGTDQYHFLLNIANEIVACPQFRDITFRLVCGRYNVDTAELKQLERKMDNLRVYENISDLRNYMLDADAVISAAGITLYELAACGTPTVGYLLADNQRDNLYAFSQKAGLISIGDIRETFPKEEIKRVLTDLRDKEKRAYLSDRLKAMVDGKGCSRLAYEIYN